MTHNTLSRRVARTSTFPHAFAAPQEFYQEPLTSKVLSEATDKRFPWGIFREEQLGCEVANRLLAAELDLDGRRVVRRSVAKALYASACFGFNNGQPILHIAGVAPSYRNVRLPRLDLDPSISARQRQSSVIDVLDESGSRRYPGILAAIENGGRFAESRIRTNARMLGQCSLELAAIPLLELELPMSHVDVQDFVAMTANGLKVDVARDIAENRSTPSIRQFVHRGSHALNDLISHPNPEVSDLALEISIDI